MHAQLLPTLYANPADGQQLLQKRYYSLRADGGAPGWGGHDIRPRNPSFRLGELQLICLECMFLEDVIISTTLGKSAEVVDGLYGRCRRAMVAFLFLMGATVEVWTISSMELSVLVSSGRGQRERQRQTKTILQLNAYTTGRSLFSYTRYSLPRIVSLGRALEGGSPKKGARSQRLFQRHFPCAADGLDTGQEEATRLPCYFDAACSSVPCSTFDKKPGTL